jgi:non-ribosomal peptide synthetase component F
MANRARPQTERVIGPVANTALICTKLDPDLSFEEALDRVRKSVTETYANQEVPFVLLAARLAQEDGLDLPPLTQVSFVLQNAFRDVLKLPGLECQPLARAGAQPVVSIDRSCVAVSLKETPAGITGAFTCKTRLLDPSKRWISDFGTILGRAAADPEAQLGGLADKAGY